MERKNNCAQKQTGDDEQRNSVGTKARSRPKGLALAFTKQTISQNIFLRSPVLACVLIDVTFTRDFQEGTHAKKNTTRGAKTFLSVCVSVFVTQSLDKSFVLGKMS